MNTDSTKGFFVGCVTATLIAIVGVFLFVLMCGWLIRGCVEVSTAAQEADNHFVPTHPEEEEEYTRVWVAGDPVLGAIKVLRVKLNGVIQDEERPTSILSIKENTTAPAALRQIDAATRDKSIRGLWLSINSPGGSVTMSDRLYTAIVRFKESVTNRFVFVHMGDLCCSGGYYAAAPANHIMARPTTLTGSIGVIMSSVNAAKLAQKIGLESVTIASAENKDLLNPLKPIKSEHVEILRKPLTQMYDRFVALVAKGRHLPEARVRTLADGRVFSAEDARQVGLIDSIGHEREALAAVRRLAGAKKVHICRYREKPSLERLLENSFLFESSSGLLQQLKATLMSEDAPTAEYRLR